MKTSPIIQWGAAAAAFAFLFLWLNERQLGKSVSTDTGGAYKKTIAGLMNQDSEKGRRVEDLNRQLLQSDSELVETKVVLRNAQARLAQLELAGQNRLPVDEARRLAGIQGRTNRFARLISPEGVVYGEQLELSSTLGKWLIFKDQQGKRTKFDLEEIHPVVLTALGLDATAMKESHEKLMDRKTKDRTAVVQAVARAQVEAGQMAREEAERQKEVAIEVAKLREERARRDEEMRLAQASLSEQRRQAMADEALRRQEIDASVFRSSALLRQAEALRLNRTTPKTVVPTPTPPTTGQ